MHRPRGDRIAKAAALLAGVASLSGCDPQREADVETGTTEVEVTTTLPEHVLSDAQLEAAAANAAALASAGADGATRGATNATPTAPPKGLAEDQHQPASTRDALFARLRALIEATPGVVGGSA